MTSENSHRDDAGEAPVVPEGTTATEGTATGETAVSEAATDETDDAAVSKRSAGSIPMKERSPHSGRSSMRPSLSMGARWSPAAEDVNVTIRGLSSTVNARLTSFFSTSTAHIRVYYLLASLIRHQSVRTANAMAFDLFLALVPMLGLAGWAATRLLLSQNDSSGRDLLTRFTPLQLQGFVEGQFRTLSDSSLAPLAALAGWWLASSAFNTMIGVFEETFECDPRTWYHTRLMSLGFSLLGMLLLGLAGGFGVVTTWHLPNELEQVARLARSLSLLAPALGLFALTVVTSFLALLYRYSLRRPDKRRRVWPGAICAAILGSLVSLGFGYYAANIASYTVFYGGLAAIVVVLLWLWLWSSAILLGAEINIALEDVAFEKWAQKRISLSALDSHSGRKSPYLAAAGPVDEPTHTPRSERNSDGA